MGPSTRFMTRMPANGTTVTNYYKQNVNDPTDNKVGTSAISSSMRMAASLPQ
jgi:hypothetical protein